MTAMKFQISLAIFLFLYSYATTQPLNDDQLDALERILTNYRNSLMVKKEIPADNQIDLYATKGLDFLISEAQSTSCASKVQQKYTQCLKANISSAENAKCSDGYVSQYSICYFGATLQYGSKDASLCDAYCVFNHDQCIINSEKLEIFVCMSARDICKSHCPVCADEGVIKRECFSRTMCSKRKSKCLKICTSKAKCELCTFTDMRCQPKCL